MSKIYRNDIFVKPEKGGDEVFNEFLRICRDQKDVLDAVIGKKTNSGAAEVVQQYREAVGLDLIKEADKKEAKPFISKRAANLAILEKYPELVKMIDSFCASSGGTKSTHSILNQLREKFGHDISFSDSELMEYIEEHKKRHHHDHSKDQNFDVGRVGIDHDSDFSDNVADYMSHGR